jgi:hypothetical protein
MVIRKPVAGSIFYDPSTTTPTGYSAPDREKFAVKPV